MYQKLSFREFDEALKSGHIKPNELGDFIELDPQSPLPKLTFRPDVLSDQPPPTYDVDEKVFQILQSFRRQREAEQKFSLIPSKSVVAEGDSWFNLFDVSVLGATITFGYPLAIADRIDSNGRVKVHNIAYWGDTLEQIIEKKRYLRAIDKYHPEYFMLSAGGNDLQLGLASGKYLCDYHPNRDVNDYLTAIGIEGVKKIAGDYRILLDELTRLHPTLGILCYGYDYPRPLKKTRDGKYGTYIGKPMHDHHIPDQLMPVIMAPIMQTLNSAIESVTGDFLTVKFLKCLGVVTDSHGEWYDDMHPNSSGFAALAAKFEAEMQ